MQVGRRAFNKYIFGIQSDFAMIALNDKLVNLIDLNKEFYNSFLPLMIGGNEHTVSFES